MTKSPQLYKMCSPHSEAGETDLNLQEYFNHKCNQKLGYNKAFLGEILGRVPKDFVQHPVAEVHIGKLSLCLKLLSSVDWKLG